MAQDPKYRVPSDYRVHYNNNCLLDQIVNYFIAANDSWWKTALPSQVPNCGDTERWHLFLQIPYSEQLNDGIYVRSRDENWQAFGLTCAHLVVVPSFRFCPLANSPLSERSKSELKFSGSKHSYSVRYLTQTRHIVCIHFCARLNLMQGWFNAGAYTGWVQKLTSSKLVFAVTTFRDI